MSRISAPLLNQRHLLWRLLWTLLVLTACADPNPAAPPVGRSHPQDYLLAHAAAANTDLDACVVCHRGDFRGTGPENDCTVCHGPVPPFALHAIPYSEADLHGAAAKEDLLFCFACHGTDPNLYDGGIVSDPGFYNRPAGNCSATACHPDAGAHPTRWQGDNDVTGDYLSTHRDADRQAATCGICHDFTRGRTAPEPRAPSCFSADFTNTDGSSMPCHSDGPKLPDHVLPYASAQAHGAAAKADLAACQVCHGTVGTIDFDGGTAGLSCASNLCHPAAGAHPTRWQGTNDVSGDYLSTHRNAGSQSVSCRICHDYTAGRTPPHPDAPSCFAVAFTNADGSATGCHSGGPDD